LFIADWHLKILQFTLNFISIDFAHVNIISYIVVEYTEKKDKPFCRIVKDSFQRRSNRGLFIHGLSTVQYIVRYISNYYAQFQARVISQFCYKSLSW
jgi:hypothetical protein